MMKKNPKRYTCFFIVLVLAMASPVLSAEGQDNNPHEAITFGTAHLSTGVTLEYAERGHGKGKAIIFLHGYTDSWFSYSGVLENLPPQYHGYALTQRGHGDSDKPAVGYAMTDFAADAVAFMDYMGIQKATVVGHSMGSVIAQRVAMDYPQRVKNLVLIGSVADALRNEVLVGFYEYVLTMVEPVDRAFVYDFQASTVYNPISVDFLETVVDESMKVPVYVWQKALGGLLVDHTPELDSIVCPTLILWGDKDDIFLYNDQLSLDQGIADSRLIIYADTGHGLHWEHPVRFVADLVEFIH